MLFPRGGGAGGGRAFVLSPVSGAVGDLPLALFVFRSPLAIASLLLPLTACFALTVLCGTTFDRERLMETGIGRKVRRVWLPIAVVRRNAVAIVAGLLLAIAPAGVAAAVTVSSGWHSWSEAGGAARGQVQNDPAPFVSTAVASKTSQANGTPIAAAAL